MQIDNETKETQTNVNDVLQFVGNRVQLYYQKKSVSVRVSVPLQSAIEQKLLRSL